MIATPNKTVKENATPSHMFFPSTRVRGGDVNIVAELKHYSTIVYAVPRRRAQIQLPGLFDLDEVIIAGRPMSLVSVTSFLDFGARHNGQDAFEQTNYRLHARLHGAPVNWLLGVSIGSLSAIAMRQLWPMPWHLGAMEFQVMYGRNEGRYVDYRLHTQSQWVNAAWEITDTGRPLHEKEGASFLGRHPSKDTITDHFRRRDDMIGSRQIRMNSHELTQGKLISAQCDLLEKLGLVTADELTRPALVALQHNVHCRLDAPQSGPRMNQRTSHQCPPRPLSFVHSL